MTTMLWQDDSDTAPVDLSSEVIDMGFRLAGGTLPVEHAHPLSTALRSALPWLEQEPRAGVHLIHVAASGNGWLRPDGSAGEVLRLSRRTRLTLRLPGERSDDARALCGQRLSLDDHRLELGKAAVRPLRPSSTLFARYVAADEDADEEAFLVWIVSVLHDLGIEPRKLLCGKSNLLATPDGPLFTRSLMIADLAPDASIRLQQEGIGTGRLMGCGLFVPHKSIDALHEPDDG
jgi:CRISPR-associated protein Cas6